MPALITEEEFTRSQALLAEFADSSVMVGTMVPVGPKVSRDSPCILVVGQASGGSFYKGEDIGYKGELSELPFIEATKMCEGMRMWLLERRRSSFWQFINRVCQLAYAPAPIDPRDIVAWSNLAKIGVVKGNPKPAQIKIQADLCAELLRTEISRLKPIATILLTGNYAQEDILYRALDCKEGDWEQSAPDKDRVASLNALGTTLLWAAHPTWMRTQKFEQEVAKYIGDKIAGKLALRG